jgi:hypothetical protein
MVADIIAADSGTGSITGVAERLRALWQEMFQALSTAAV